MKHYYTFHRKIISVKMHETLKQKSVEVLVVGGWEDGGRQMTNFPTVKLNINKTLSYNNYCGLTFCEVPCGV